MYAIVTHGIFSGNALAKVNECQLEALAVTNTVPQHYEQCSKIKVLCKRITEKFCFGTNFIKSGYNNISHFVFLCFKFIKNKIFD